MTAVADAMQVVLTTQHNAINLADPEQAASLAMTAWMQAVTNAIEASASPVASEPEPPVDSAHVETGAEQFSQATIEGAAQAAAAAFAEAIVHPVADAAPASTEPPVIAPSNPT